MHQTLVLSQCFCSLAAWRPINLSLIEMSKWCLELLETQVKQATVSSVLWVHKMTLWFWSNVLWTCTSVTKTHSQLTNSVKLSLTSPNRTTTVHDIIFFLMFNQSEHPFPLSFMRFFHLSLPHSFSWHLQRLKDKVALCPDKGEDSSAWMWMFSHEIRTELCVFYRQGDGSSFGGSQNETE